MYTIPMLVDTHVHLYDVCNHFLRKRQDQDRSPSFEIPKNTYFCASSHTKDEFLWHEEKAKTGHTIILSHGVHPQQADYNLLFFLEQILHEHRIQAIGECGYDYYTEAFKSTENKQKIVREAQYELAIKFQLPVIIHCRKAMDALFSDIHFLKKIPAVIFHGWAGSHTEARSLLNRGINAYFCVGKALTRGKKSLIQTIEHVPSSHLLTETDAPYMQDKGQSYTPLGDIHKVYAALAKLKKIKEAELQEIILDNFLSIFKM